MLHELPQTNKHVALCFSKRGRLKDPEGDKKNMWLKAGFNIQGKSRDIMFRISGIELMYYKSIKKDRIEELMLIVIAIGVIWFCLLH